MGHRKSNPPGVGTVVLGERLRQIRKDRGLTLTELGTATGLSHAFLSQVERARARPSMSTLERIASALGISVAALVAQASNGLARAVRGAEAPTVSVDPNQDNVTVRVLTGRDALMKVTETVGSFPLSPPMAHPGEEVVYVIEGEIEVDVGGEVFRLGAGDALNFDCSVEHTYRTMSDTPSRVLVIAVDPGQYAGAIDESTYAYRLASGRPRS